MIDKAAHLFLNFVKTHVEYPKILSSDNPVVIDHINSNTPFINIHRSWFTDERKNVLLPNLTLDYERDFLIRQVPNDPESNTLEDEANDVFRSYEIKVRLTHENTKVKTYLSQTIQLSASKLFDYATFFNDDLELCPGPTASYQGPIFSNGDIYLMNDAGSRLSIMQPSSDYAGKQPYVLGTAGNVFFYFKRALAKNYLLDKESNGDFKYPEIAKYFHSDYKTGSGAFTYLKDVHGNYLEGNPLGYDANQKRLPLFYFFRNKNRILFDAPEAATDPNSFCYGKNHYNCHAFRVQADRSNPDTSWSDLPSRAIWENYGHGYGQTYRPYWYFRLLYKNVSNPADYGSAWSISGAYNTSHPLGEFELFPAGKVGPNDPGWTPENPVSTRPWPNMSTGGYESASGWIPPALSGAVVEGMDKKPVPAGSPDGDPRTFILPISGSDTASVKKVKFHYKANLVFNCTAESNACSAFKSLNGEPVPTGSPLQVPGQDGSTVIYSTKDFYDYRLKGSKKVIQIDVKKLIDFAKTEDKQIGIPNAEGAIEALIVYVQVSDVLSGKISEVILTNGADLTGLPKGLTIATNGRVWIAGNYNTSVIAATGKVPSTSVFADSFGVLSTSSFVPWNSGTTTSARKVLNDITVNTAVVAGYLPSQLQQRFFPPFFDHYWEDPDDKSVSYDGQFPGTVKDAFSEDVPEKPRRPDFYPTEAEADAAGRYVCPDGVDLDESSARYGEPKIPPTSSTDTRICNCSNDACVFDGTTTPCGPSDCEAWLDKNTGYWYYNKGKYKRKSDGAILNSGVAAYKITGNPSDVTTCEPNAYGRCKFVLDTANYEVIRQPYHQFKKYYYEGLHDGKQSSILPAFENVKLYFRAKVPDWEIPVFADQTFPVYCPGITSKTSYNIFICDSPVPYSNLCPTGDCTRSTGVWNEWWGRGQWTMHFKCNQPQEAPSIAGVSQAMLWRKTLYADQLIGGGEYKCDKPQPCGGENLPSCCYWSGTTGVRTEPGVRYDHGRYNSLYGDAMYSGGLENLINFQEDWTGKYFNFNGALTKLWDAEELKVSEDRPAYFKTYYYRAPNRNLNYNADFAANPPPGTPNIYAIKRKAFKELNPYTADGGSEEPTDPATDPVTTPNG